MNQELLPEIQVATEALESRIAGQVLERVQIGGPFLLRTADPPVSSAFGHRVTKLRRVGKRIAIGLDNDIWLVLHLMIAGRLHWSEKRKQPDGRRTLAAFDFDSGTLPMTEAMAVRSLLGGVSLGLMIAFSVTQGRRAFFLLRRLGLLPAPATSGQNEKAAA